MKTRFYCIDFFTIDKKINDYLTIEAKSITHALSKFKKKHANSMKNIEITQIELLKD